MQSAAASSDRPDVVSHGGAALAREYAPRVVSPERADAYSMKTSPRLPPLARPQGRRPGLGGLQVPGRYQERPLPLQ